MDYEATLNQALDLLADSENRKAGRLLQSCIDDIKKNLAHDESDLNRFYYWGRCLTAMEEPEQALLKFEKAMRIDPDHEGSLWETASLLYHDMERPESAQPILAERLVKLYPENELYHETLRSVNFSLKIRKSPPPLSKEEADALLENEGEDPIKGS